MPLPLIYHQVKQFLAEIDQESTIINHKLVTTEIEKFIAEIPPTFDDMEPLARSLGVEIHKQFHQLIGLIFATIPVGK